MLRGMGVGFPAGARKFSLLSRALTVLGANPASCITGKHKVQVATNRLLSSDATRTTQKTTPPTILHYRGIYLPSRCLVTIGYVAQSNKLLVALDSAVILDAESHGIDDHVLLPDGSGS
jgi:hypothetical protein